MLSRFLTSAKSIFSPTSQSEASLPPGPTLEISKEMVTTRQNGKSASIESTEESIIVETPRSSRKRGRKPDDVEDAAAESGTVALGSGSKKQKILPVRVKDDEMRTTNTRVVVEIPVSKMAIELQAAKDTPKARGVIEINDSDASDEEAEAGNMDENEAAEPEQATPTAKPSKSPKKAAKQTTPKTIKTPTVPSSATMPAQTPKHRRFGSDEPEEFFSTAVSQMRAPTPEESSSESDDDAPEAVSTQAAQKSVESKAQDAARAIEGQETAIRQKRKDRDAVLKKQAQVANKKRKHAEVEDEDAASAEHPKKTKPDPISIKFDPRAPLPDLLPEEYLDDSSPSLSDDEEESDTPHPVRQAKKTKFLDLVDKKPKDRRKGDITYRVADVQSSKLAPKASVTARSLKEMWLQQGRGKAGKPNPDRVPFKKGFFVRK